MSIAKGLILLIFLLMLYIIIYLKRENFKQKDFFVKTLSHDFRVATLAQLRGIEILSHTNGFDSRQCELIDEIEHSCRYSLEMISMLMNIYSFEKGKQIVSYEIFSLNEIINLVIETLKIQIKDKNIDMFFDMDNLVKVKADKELTFKLNLNLLSTAISYAEANSTIILTSKNDNGFWEFKVCYEGKSLTNEECARMFLRQTHFSTVGHGIKMFFSKKIVEFHGGEIFVKNCSENLNSFTFCIPQKQKKYIYKTHTMAKLQPN